MSQVADRVCTKCFDEPTLMVDKPCRRCHFTRGFGWSNWRPRITQSAARALLAACETADGSVLPYRGADASPERTYTVSRAAVKEIREAVAETKGESDETA